MFFGESKGTGVAHSNNDSARIDLSNELLYASNGDRMPKL